MEWNEAAQRCAKEPDVEQCIKAYLTLQATQGCIAGGTGATVGAGAAASTVACVTVVPIVVDLVWKYAWPAATAIWDGAESLLGDVWGGIKGFLEGAWNTVTFGLFGSDEGRMFGEWVVTDTYGPLGNTLNAASDAGKRGVIDVARNLGMPAPVSPAEAAAAVAKAAKAAATLGAMGGYDSVKANLRPSLVQKISPDAVWSADDVWQDALMSQKDWSGRLVLDDGKGHVVEFWGAGENEKPKGAKWYPAVWGVTAPNPMRFEDMNAVYALANQGMQRRLSAIPGAIMEASTALAVRRVQLDQAAAERGSSSSGWLALLGLGAAAGLGYWLWRKK